MSPLSAGARKPLRDLSRAKLSTALVVVAMSAAVAAATAFAFAAPVLERETERSYLESSPPHLLLRLAEGQGEEAALRAASSLTELPGVAAVEPERALTARARNRQGRWKTVLLQVWPQGEPGAIGRVTADGEAPVATPGGLWIEGSSRGLLGWAIGDEVVVQVGEAPPATLRITGEVHDGSQAPGWMEDLVYAYAHPQTLDSLGMAATFDRLALLARPDDADPDALAALAAAAEARLREQGIEVEEVRSPPRQHPHQSQVDSLIWTLVILGLLTLLLAGLLVSTALATVMARQTRWIAVLKALGANRRQTLRIFLPLVWMPALLALPLGVALGLPLGRAYARFAAGILNAEIASWAPDPARLGGVLLVTLLVVGLAGLGPIWRQSRLTVREGLQAASGASSFGRRWSDRASLVLGRFGTHAAMALRNLLRTPRRTLPTLILLSLAGALFTASLNVGRSWTRTIENENAAAGHDLEIHFATPLPPAEIAGVLDGLPDLARVELRRLAYLTASGTARAEDDDFAVYALDPRQPIVAPRLLGGRWLEDAAEPQAVLSRRLARSLGVAVGEVLIVEGESQQRQWRIAGVVDELLGEAAYVSPATLELLLGPHLVHQALVALERPAADDPWAAAETLESRLKDADVPLRRIRTTASRHGSLLAHVVIFSRTAVLVATLLAAVAAFGLASALALAVVERSKELGVLRALGASPSRVGGLLRSEALFAVASSALLAAITSLPLTLVVNHSSGQIFLERPLDAACSPVGYLLWTLGLAVVAWGASSWPARNAGRAPLAPLLADD